MILRHIRQNEHDVVGPGAIRVYREHTREHENEYCTSYSNVLHIVPTSCTCILMNGQYLEVTQVIHVHVKTKPIFSSCTIADSKCCREN